MLSRNSILALGLVGVLGAYGAYELTTRVILVDKENKLPEVPADEIPEQDVQEEVQIPPEPPSPPVVQPEDKEIKKPESESEDKNTLLQNLPSGSLGEKFKKHLIGDPEDKLWDMKLQMWQTGIKSGSAKGPFDVGNKKNTIVTKQQLTNRCSNAYKMQWSQIPGSRPVDKQNYKSAVWTHCGNDVEAPKNWYY